MTGIIFYSELDEEAPVNIIPETRASILSCGTKSSKSILVKSDD